MRTSARLVANLQGQQVLLEDRSKFLVVVVVIFARSGRSVLQCHPYLRKRRSSSSLSSPGHDIHTCPNAQLWNKHASPLHWHGYEQAQLMQPKLSP
mmetsp:Transcript_11778/g.32468  ORF Transcript_11778/g.32468 Transcript_11778/m.32468 type:complete len:96 (+) Transcript_11778:732-1019(+)